MQEMTPIMLTLGLSVAINDAEHGLDQAITLATELTTNSPGRNALVNALQALQVARRLLEGELAEHAE